MMTTSQKKDIVEPPLLSGALVFGDQSKEDRQEQYKKKRSWIEENKRYKIERDKRGIDGLSRPEVRNKGK